MLVGSVNYYDARQTDVVRNQILYTSKLDPNIEHLIVVDKTYAVASRNDLVYNYAPIDAQHIVWARSLGIVRDRKLCDNYPNRKSWKLSCAAPSLTQCKLFPFNEQLPSNN